jgi:hypothetical protein
MCSFWIRCKVQNLYCLEESAENYCVLYSEASFQKFSGFRLSCDSLSVCKTKAVILSQFVLTC